MKNFMTIIMVVVSSALYAQNDTLKSYTTQRISGAAPAIDGILDDEAWKDVDWGGDFLQREPEQGEKPSEPTAFKILYDAKNLYIAIMAYDSEPDKIVKRMSRRDGFEGDWVEINIDSYHDKRTAFSFTSSVSGVKGDEYISNNGDNWDSSWDPIWYLRTSVIDSGWVAELRIPLSQLRFADVPEHTWGIQFTRRFFRNDERSLWQFVPREAQGWVHRFGELRGIKGIKPQKQLEIQPYVLAKTERFEREEGNPFATGRSSDITVGLDGKVGLTSDVTLDFTINPDFGQVEADPSQVNLSAFQVFFREQRPFFIEGNDILNFPVSRSLAGANFESDNVLYSRRIGGSPHHSPDLEDGEYSDQPQNSSILGAAKLTGKNKKGFSFGILESLTAKEKAIIDTNGERREEVVEPLTNYFAGRVQQDFNEGNTVIGGMLTATHRDIQDDALNFLHKNAYSAGLDLRHFWKNRTYSLTFNGVASRVNGTENAVQRTQESAERFFQRPDNRSSSLDTTRTSLTGTGGTLTFGKNSGKFLYQTGGTWRSPSLELNDIGFLRSADFLSHWTWLRYRILKPFSVFRSANFRGRYRLRWDFDGVNMRKSLWVNSNAQLKNFWWIWTGANIQGDIVSNADLRGGPSIRYPGGINYWYGFDTDRRKKISFNLEQWFYWGYQKVSTEKGFWTSINYQPTDALRISLSPNASFNKTLLQYVSTEDNERTGKEEYIVASIKQNTYNLSFRLNFNINPNLSVQYWGQPFVSRGEYSAFKKVTQSDAAVFTDRFRVFAPQEISYDSEEDEYIVDENTDGTADFRIENPNFNIVELRSNMVMRWEYIPGSTLFLVWTQGRSDNLTLQDDNTIGTIGKDLFRVAPRNTFLIKYTYRFIL